MFYTKTEMWNNGEQKKKAVFTPTYLCLDQVFIQREGLAVRFNTETAFCMWCF